MHVRVIVDLEINEKTWDNGMCRGVVPVRMYDVGDAVGELLERSNTFGDTRTVRIRAEEVSSTGRRKRSDAGKRRKAA